MISNSVFQKILGECEDAKAKLAACDFRTEKGLYTKISKDHLSAEFGKVSNLELYLVQQDAHYCLQEIGHLREEAFSRLGGGTHKQLDLDNWDYSGFWQLLCIDTEAQEICGAYRLLHGPEIYGPEIHAPEISTRASPKSSVHSLFGFSTTMLEQILPRAIELGRSFVNEQAQQARLALAFLFEALGQILCQNADYVLGKITFYPETLSPATLLLLSRFLEHYWGEQNNPLIVETALKMDAQIETKMDTKRPLAWPREGLDFHSIPLMQEAQYPKTEFEELSSRLLAELPQSFNRKALKTLLHYTDQCHDLEPNEQKYSKNAPLRSLRLFLKYLSLLREDSNGMHYYGGAVNPHFGNVIEFMTLAEIQQFRNLQRWRA